MAWPPAAIDMPANDSRHPLAEHLFRVNGFAPNEELAERLIRVAVQGFQQFNNSRASSLQFVQELS